MVHVYWYLLLFLFLLFLSHRTSCGANLASMVTDGDYDLLGILLEYILFCVLKVVDV